VTSYLRWDPAVGTAAPAGYVGDPTVPHAILPGPSGFDFFRARGPNAGGPGVNVVRTDPFNVQGTLWNPTQPMLGLVSTHNNVDFGTVALGATGALPAQTATLTNAGGGQTPLRLQGLSVSGANSAQFTLANDTCTNASLAPGATCTVDVSCTPGAIAGPATARLDVPSTNGKDSVGGQRILLHGRVSDGTGTDARVTGPVDAVNGFPQWYQDEAGTRVALCDDQNDPIRSELTASGTSATVTPSQPASVTLTNVGDAAADPRVSLPAVSGFSIVDDGCAGPLAPTASCTVTVGLDPQAPAHPVRPACCGSTTTARGRSR